MAGVERTWKCGGRRTHTQSGHRCGRYHRCPQAPLVSVVCWYRSGGRVDGTGRCSCGMGPRARTGTRPAATIAGIARGHRARGMWRCHAHLKQLILTVTPVCTVSEHGGRPRAAGNRAAAGRRFDRGHDALRFRRQCARPRRHAAMCRCVSRHGRCPGARRGGECAGRWFAAAHPGPGCTGRRHLLGRRRPETVHVRRNCSGFARGQGGTGPRPHQHRRSRKFRCSVRTHRGRARTRVPWLPLRSMTSFFFVQALREAVQRDASRWRPSAANDNRHCAPTSAQAAGARTLIRAVRSA